MKRHDFINTGYKVRHKNGFVTFLNAVVVIGAIIFMYHTFFVWPQ